MTGKSTHGSLHQVVNGVCPTCEEDTLLVSITREYYRCVTCGTDLEQDVNGKIIYLPTLAGKTLQSQIDKFLKMAKRTLISLYLDQSLKTPKKTHKKPK